MLPGRATGVNTPLGLSVWQADIAIDASPRLPFYLVSSCCKHLNELSIGDEQRITGRPRN